MIKFRALTSAAVVVALMLASPGLAGAQGTALVPTSDPAYVDIDRLNLLGLLDSVVVGQRPYSEREFDRLVTMAEQRAYGGALRSAEETAVIEGALARLERRFGVKGSANRRSLDLVDDATLVATSTDAQRRPLLGVFGKPTEATIDPLADRRLGDPAVRGQSLALELAQRAEPTNWLAFNLRERIELRAPRDSTLSKQHGELLLGGMRARFGNLALSLGREQFTWAQRDGDGLFLASDAPALDQVSLASDAPFQLPGFLSRLGPAAGTIVLADLGQSVVRSHSKLLAYKLSVEPTSSLELGATFENHFEGTGARGSSALNRLVDFLPFIDIFRRHNYSDTTRALEVQSDKTIGGDARLTVQRLGGLVITGEWLIDDFDVTRLLALFTNDASQSVAFLFPRVGTPRVSLELSAKHMGIYTYTHATFTNGMTTRGRLLGDELGPDAKAYGATLRWQVGTNTVLMVDGRTALYSDVKYYGDLVGTQAEVFKLSSNPNELRDRLLVSLRRRASGNTSVFARTGAERIRNARYFGDRASYVAELGVDLHD